MMCCELNAKHFHFGANSAQAMKRTTVSRCGMLIVALAVCNLNLDGQVWASCFSQC